MSKAVIFFAPGLEECEGLLCVDLLRRSGVEVTIAAVGGEKIVKSARSISVVADALAEEPITLRMKGSYHQFGAFVSGVASLPRVVILTMHDVSLMRS